VPKKNYSGWTKEELIAHIEKLEKRKKYGLVWDEERTREEFEMQAQNSLPVLEAVIENDVTADPTQPTHILIEGDNFHALSVLNYTRESSVSASFQQGGWIRRTPALLRFSLVRFVRLFSYCLPEIIPRQAFSGLDTLARPIQQGLETRRARQNQIFQIFIICWRQQHRNRSPISCNHDRAAG